jgi:hypothetical protein
MACDCFGKKINDVRDLCARHQTAYYNYSMDLVETNLPTAQDWYNKIAVPADNAASAEVFLRATPYTIDDRVKRSLEHVPANLRGVEKRTWLFFIDGVPRFTWPLPKTDMHLLMARVFRLQAAGHNVYVTEVLNDLTELELLNAGVLTVLKAPPLK